MPAVVRRNAAYWLGALFLVALLALAAADPLLHGGHRWTKWPMVAQVSSGLLLLALTVFSIDTLVRRRDDRARARELETRWRGLGGIPFRSLAAVCGDLVDAQGWMLTGHHPYGRPGELSADDAVTLQRLLDRLDVPARSIPSGHEAASFEANIARTLTAPEWCGFAHSRLHLVKRGFREGVALWTMPMFSLDALADVLRRMADLDDLVSDLQGHLARLGKLPGELPGDACQAKDAWFTTLAAAVSLREDLIRAAVATRALDRAHVEAHLAAWTRMRGWIPAGNPAAARLRRRAAAVEPLGAGGPLATDGQEEWLARCREVLATRFDDDATDALLAGWTKPAAKRAKKRVAA